MVFYHRNRRVTKTEVGTESRVGMKNLSMLIFGENIKNFGTLDQKSS